MISIIPDRGLHFPGHTESLAWLEGRPHVGLSLVLHSDHRGRHVETHPVCQICDMILHYYYFYTNVLAPIGALGVAISVCLSVCLSVPLAESCLEHSIFIFQPHILHDDFMMTSG